MGLGNTCPGGMMQSLNTWRSWAPFTPDLPGTVSWVIYVWGASKCMRRDAVATNGSKEILQVYCFWRWVQPDVERKGGWSPLLLARRRQVGWIPTFMPVSSINEKHNTSRLNQHVLKWECMLRIYTASLTSLSKWSKWTRERNGDKFPEIQIFINKYEFKFHWLA